MLDAFIIDSLREDANRRSHQERPVLHRPPPPPPEPRERREDNSKRGAAEVSFTL
jgi:hypothetical protein